MRTRGFWQAPEKLPHADAHNPAHPCLQLHFLRLSYKPLAMLVSQVSMQGPGLHICDEVWGDVPSMKLQLQQPCSLTAHFIEGTRGPAACLPPPQKVEKPLCHESNDSVIRCDAGMGPQARDPWFCHQTYGCMRGYAGRTPGCFMELLPDPAWGRAR